MQLSRYFTLADLTVTSTGYQNNPVGIATQNLSQLASLLDEVYEKIGPFKINSAFRSPEVNKVIGGSGASLHMEGKAADLQPLTMNAETFFAKIAASPLKNKMGEIINESERGIVHVTTPTWSMRGVLKYLSEGEYFRYTQEQLSKVVSFGKENPIITSILLASMGGAILYFLTRKK